MADESDMNAEIDRLQTLFASPERASDRQLQEMVAIVAASPVVDAILRSAGGAVAVLNKHRQILALNDSYLGLTGLSSPYELHGLRVGETVGCAYSKEMPAGCGTSRACGSCGAVISMLTCLASKEACERECAIRLKANETIQELDFAVRAVPFSIEGEELVLIFLKDISAEKRRAGLEKSFLHDLNNLVHGLTFTGEFLDFETPEHYRQIASEMSNIAIRLRREIEIQRALAHEKPGLCQLHLESVSAKQTLFILSSVFFRHPAAKNRRLNCVPLTEDILLSTDRSFLERILINMVVNALEASNDGGEVRVSITNRDTELVFSVHNDTVIPSAVIPRIFQRYFSTKEGLARGQGTFSMKLFAEQYLGGKLSFSSSQQFGTEFLLCLPKTGPDTTLR